LLAADLETPPAVLVAVAVELADTELILALVVALLALNQSYLCFLQQIIQ
jgi:hypothetical protein